MVIEELHFDSTICLDSVRSLSCARKSQCAYEEGVQGKTAACDRGKDQEAW